MHENREVHKKLVVKYQCDSWKETAYVSLNPGHKLRTSLTPSLLYTGRVWEAQRCTGCIFTECRWTRKPVIVQPSRPYTLVGFVDFAECSSHWMCKKDPPREQQKHLTWEKESKEASMDVMSKGKSESWGQMHINSAACLDSQKFTEENHLWHGKLTHLFIQEIFEVLLCARHISNSQGIEP